MMEQPFYDPQLSYEANFETGPFGAFADGEQLHRLDEPQVEFLGQKLFQPFGIPAGPLINGKFVAAAFAKGFDLNVYKTVRTKFYPCHPNPNVLAAKIEGELSLERAQQPVVADENYEEPLSITNSFGVPSMDPDWWQPDMAAAVQAAGKGQALIGGFQGTKLPGGSVQDFIDDYVLGARLVKETGAPILAANLSCPNEGTAELLCFDVERVRQIADQIKNEIGNTPLLLKLAYFAEEAHLAELVAKVGPIVDGLIAINTIPALVVNEAGKPALPGKGRERSGICGASIKWAGLEMVKRLVQLRAEYDQQFVVVGVGGVMSAQDYADYRQLGADAVLSATGAMWQPHLAMEIWEERN